MDYKNYWKGKEVEWHSIKYYKNLYDEIKKHLKPTGNVLDIGGGNGQFLKYLEAKNADILDIADIKTEYNLIQADIREELPLNNNTYDTIYCMEVLEHLKDSKLLISEINRLLKPNGKAVFSVPNIWREQLNEEHLKKWKFKELLKEIKDCDYDQVFYYKRPRLKNTNWGIITKQIAKILPNIFASGFVIVGVKSKPL